MVLRRDPCTVDAIIQGGDAEIAGIDGDVDVAGRIKTDCSFTFLISQNDIVGQISNDELGVGAGLAIYSHTARQVALAGHGRAAVSALGGSRCERLRLRNEPAAEEHHGRGTPQQQRTA